MTATNHTNNYNLSQFVGTDRPTWLGDYNGDMSKIDTQMKANADAIEQAAAGGLKSVSHTADLTGDGTSKSPLGIAATIARKTDIPDTSGFATTKSVTQAIAAAIANRLTAGDIKAGNGINIKTSGNTVTISYSNIPEVSALTSRIATLESQVAALTTAAPPHTTGLTATQLDTQYLDDYNIVRAGTPTHSSESEESSQ